MRSEARRVFRRLMQLRELEGGRGAGGWWRGTLRGPPMTTERLAAPLPADVRAIGARTRDVECLLRQDRNSVVSGKSVSVRVELGCRPIITKKKTNTTSCA